MKKLLKSKKALSPVVAAIILIAVTVAVSIAVAVWMGSLTFNFMDTEPLTITKVSFPTGDTDAINVTVMNTGTSDIIITGVTVTGSGVTGATLDVTSYTITKGDTSEQIDIDLTGAWVAGAAYNVELLSSKGNKFSYTEIA
jgi:flagellin-like protein